MARDPVTLLVALDNEHRAKGQLYWDDGESFAFSTAGESVLRDFEVKDGVLSCNKNSAAASNGSGYKSGLSVERIIVVGLDKEPAAAINVVSDGQRVLEHSWTAAHVLTVRKPELSLDEDWQVKLF